MSDTQIIEINGIKLEVDMRTARRIDTLKVGSKVKVLVPDYSSNSKIYPGVVAGFEPFKELPTIVVAYFEINYASAEVKFAYVNAKSDKNLSIVQSVDDDLPIEKDKALAMFNKQIATKQNEIEEIERRRDWFVEHFGVHFGAALEA